MDNSSVSTSHGPPPGVLMYFVIGSVHYTVGFPLNVWALWLIVSTKATRTEILTVNLILMETVSSVCFLLVVVESLSRSFSIKPLSYFHHASVVVGRALFPCQVCVDRYLAVVHPMAFIRYKQIKYRGSCLAVLWLFAIGGGLINIIFPMNFTVVSVCSFAVFVPVLSAETFCSLSILRVLRRPGPGHKESREKKEVNQQKRRAVQVISVALVTLTLNHVPFILVPFFTHDAEDFFAAALALSCLGSPIQAVLFLSRSGRLSCKSTC